MTSPSARCCRIASVFAIAHLEVSGPIKIASAALYPGTDPGQHRVDADTGRTELSAESRRVSEQSVNGFGAGEFRSAAQELTQTRGNVTHGENLGPTEVPDGWRRAGERERAQDHVVGVALPNAVEVAVGEIDRLARMNLLRDIDKHAIPQFDRIEQSQQR